MKSDIFKLNFRDFAKGLVMAVLGAIVAALYTTIAAGKLPTLEELKTAAIVGLGAGLTYLVKNFFSDGTKEAAETLESQGYSVIKKYTGPQSSNS